MRIMMVRRFTVMQHFLAQLAKSAYSEPKEANGMRMPLIILANGLVNHVGVSGFSGLC